jgi:transcriptional regulator with XRE-family HTH domain
VRAPLRKRFGLRVAELRHAAKLSQEALADRCGFARSYMSRIERGKANPSLDAIETLAGGLRVSVQGLFRD